MKNACPIILLFVLLATAVTATHNRAGYIAYRQIDNHSVEATVVTWTRATSLPADRDTLTICWGDDNCERVVRVNGPGNPPQGDIIGFNYKRNFYTAIHTYDEMGTYTISMTDPNRNGGVININFPNSEQVVFHLEAVVTLMDVEGGRDNHSPQVLAEPILIGHIFQPFVYTPAAYDPDADSLSYEWMVPLQDTGLPVPNYVELTDIEANSDNQLSLDPHTGKMVWDAPHRAGQYGTALRIRSFRDGVEIGSTVLDMEIVIENNANTMPAINISPAYSESHLHCLSVGDTLELDIAAQDENVMETVTLEFFSSLTETLSAPQGFSYTGSDNEGAFRWIVTEDQAQEQPYQMAIRAIDEQGYANYRVLRFVVKGCADNEAAQQISGICFWDTNENGLYEEGEALLAGRQLSLQQAGLLTASNAEGQYTFYLSPGQYLLESLPDPCWFLTTDSTATISLEEGEEASVHFGFNRTFDNDTEFEASLASGTTRCNREVPFWLSLTNTACRPNGGWIALIRDENLASLSSANIAPDFISGDTLWWAFPPFVPGKALIWELNFQLGGPQFLGMEMDFELLVFSEDCLPIGQTDIQGPWAAGMENLSYCERYLYSPVLLCAYDPNDKLVQPARGEGKNLTLFDEQIEYTIRFQNTGNDTAFTVTLRDTLDPGLDWKSFSPFTASHPYEFVLDQSTGVLIFTFRDINLPDSTTNELASQGFVTYTISSRPGLEENTLVTNRAGIYFDSNPPIITNTTENTLVSHIPGVTATENYSSRKGIEAKVYPNPFSDAVHFEIQSSQAQRMLLEIFDLSGRLLYSSFEGLLPGKTIISASGHLFPGKGAFIYKICTPEGLRSGKIIRL